MSESGKPWRRWKLPCWRRAGWGRKAGALVAALALIGLVACVGSSEPDRRGTATSSPSPPAISPTSGATGSPASPKATPTGSTVTTVAGGQVARVTRVIDGDTIEVAIEGQTFSVRYIGMDTPETVAAGRPVECFGPQASARNKELVDGRTVELEKDVSETDRYGRLLRYVYVDGRMVNELLVAEGFAQVSTYPPDVKYADRFLEAQRLARDQGLGLWGACVPGEPTPTPGAVAPPPTRVPGEGAARVVIDPSCSGFNSPGDDDLTATEEYVCFRNTGGAAATMTGWSVSDFGGRHAYVFASFTLAAGAAMRLRSGCGANTGSDLYWCAGGAVWNNGGDVVTLRDGVGNVVASYSYGSPS